MKPLVEPGEHPLEKDFVTTSMIRIRQGTLGGVSTLLKLLHACPEGDQERAQASNQVPKSPAPRQTCQHPCLLCLALPLSKTFKHQVFLKGDVWNHACFLVPFCQTPSSRRLSSRKTSRSRTASSGSWGREEQVGYLLWLIDLHIVIRTWQEEELGRWKQFMKASVHAGIQVRIARAEDDAHWWSERLHLRDPLRPISHGEE